MRRKRLAFVVVLVAVVLFASGIGSVGIASEADGTYALSETDTFYNVIGSTPDKTHKYNGKTYTSSTLVWEAALEIQRSTCFVKGCTNIASAGGHIVLDPSYIRPIEASGTHHEALNSVYILPICGSHNGQDCKPLVPKNGALVLKLKNYCRSSSDRFNKCREGEKRKCP